MSNTRNTSKRSFFSLYNIAELAWVTLISICGVAILYCAPQYKGTHAESVIKTAGSAIAALPLIYYAFKYAPLYNPRPESDT